MKRSILLLAITVFICATISACMNDTKVESTAKEVARSTAEKVAKSTAEEVAKSTIEKFMKKPEKVFITSDSEKGNKPIVSRPVIILKTGDQVMWKTEPGKNFTVRFNKGNGTPFQESEFGNGSGQHDTGTVIVNPPPGKPEKYGYSVELDGEILDPMIIVWN